MGDVSNFEVERFRQYNEQFRLNDCNGTPKNDIIKIQGSTVLVSCPHACRHYRNGRLLSADAYTGAIGLYLQELTGCSLLIKAGNTGTDSNFEVDNYKTEIGDVIQHGCQLILDIHGKSSSEIDVDIGTDGYSNVHKNIVDSLGAYLTRYGFTWTVDNEFRASNENTVSKFSRTHYNVAAIQLEISRQVRYSDRIITMCQALSEFITDASTVLRPASVDK